MPVRAMSTRLEESHEEDPAELGCDLIVRSDCVLYGYPCGCR